MVTGIGLALGAGLGWIMRLGALRRFIMDGGRLLVAHGAGAQGRFMVARSMDRRSLASSAADLASASAVVLVAESVGSRSGFANHFILGTTPAETTSAT